MGMDYQYSGSASYPRFERELRELAKIFGGKECKSKIDKEVLGNRYGYPNNFYDEKERFEFPVGTNSVLVKWFNHPYGLDWTREETKIIYEELCEYEEDAKEASSDIMHEFQCLVDNNEAWYIY